MSLSDKRAIENGINLAERREQEMADHAECVRNWGNIRSRWDSKVPSNEKSFWDIWSWCTFQESDKVKIVEEISAHKELYAKFKKAMEKVQNGDENADIFLDELSELLQKTVEESESKSGSTNSSTLCRMYRNFADEKNVLRLDNMIRRGQALAGKQAIANMKGEYEKALEEIKNIRDDLKTENTELAKNFKDLMDLNKAMLTQQEELIKELKAAKKEQD